MDSIKRHPELAAFGPMMNPGPSELDEHVGKKVYLRREPGEFPEYSINVNGVNVQRSVEWDHAQEEIIPHDYPQEYTVGHTQKIYDGSLALRIYARDGDFGRPAKVEEVVFI